MFEEHFRRLELFKFLSKSSKQHTTENSLTLLRRDLGDKDYKGPSVGSKRHCRAKRVLLNHSDGPCPFLDGFHELYQTVVEPDCLENAYDFVSLPGSFNRHRSRCIRLTLKLSCWRSARQAAHRSNV